MPLPTDINHLNAAAWRNAKKEAGVKGAGFFDSSSGKAVADKIDAFQQKKVKFNAKIDKKTSDELVKASQTLLTALNTVKKDRTFTGDVQQQFKGAIDKLILGLKDVEKAAQEAAENENQSKPSGIAAQRKQALDRLNGINAAKDILKDPVLRPEFSKYAAKQSFKENIDFLEVVSKSPKSSDMIRYFDRTDRVNIDETAEQAAKTGNLKPALEEVMGNLDGRVPSFKTYLKKEWA